MPFARVPDELRHHPFTTAQAARYGVGTSALRGLQWRHVFRDVWVHADVADTREARLAAAMLIRRDDGFVCGLTAAWLYGIEVQDRRGDLVWVGHPTGSRPRTRAGVMVREITVASDDLRVLDGIPVTTELRTVFDCARWLSLVEAVVVADCLAKAGLVSIAALRSYYKRHRALRGVRQVARVLELMDQLSESPMESRLRLLLVLAGLPRPGAQLVIRDDRGEFVARVDLGYPDQRLVVEYDGSLHWTQRREDDRRRDAIRRLGWTVLVVSAEDYYQHPATVVATVAAALRSASSLSSPTYKAAEHSSAANDVRLAGYGGRGG